MRARRASGAATTTQEGAPTMHILATTSASLDDRVEPVDLGQAPGDVAVLSFTDSDLAAVAAAWRATADGARPTLRLASLRDLRHPMSVDLWIDQVAAAARVVVVRLLGGLDWWRYGAERLAALAAERSAADRPLALILLPGDDRDDERLAALSTLPPDRLAALLAYFREGGPENMRNFARHLRAMAEDRPSAEGANLGEGHAAGEGNPLGASPPPSPRDADANPPPSQRNTDAKPPPSWGRACPGLDPGVGRGGAASPSLHDGHPVHREVFPDASLADAESAAPPLPTLPHEGGGFNRAISPDRARESSKPGRQPHPAPADAIPPAVPIPRATAWLPERGAVSLADLLAALPAGAPVVPVLFYRSMLLAGDVAPIAALAAALAGRGLAAAPLAVASLKEPGARAFVAEALARLAPAVIVTATAFAAGEPGEPTVLDGPGVPVLQAVVATTRREAWAEGRRGLAAADMAMHVVLPEIDGRVLAGALSFKAATEPDPDFAVTRLVNHPEDDRIAAVADRVAALVRLQRTPPAERRLVVLLPDYPGPAGRAGYAVGLDVPASVVALIADLAAAGFSVADAPADGTALMREVLRAGGLTADEIREEPEPDLPRPACSTLPTDLNANPPPSRGRACPGLDPRVGRGGAASPSLDDGHHIRRASLHGISLADAEFAAPPLPTLPREGGGFSWVSESAQSDAMAAAGGASSLPLATYRSLFAALPAAVRETVIAAWGDPADDPDLAGDAFSFRARSFGAVTVALPPDRGRTADRRADYHDPALPPRHALVAFALWLRHRLAVHAVIHMGAHGTFEWLPGKAVALTGGCFPEALLAPLPVVYPFIVTNPGEAAQAKRRIAAVTLGHLPPPLVAGALDGPLAELERLVDEYASADGLDGRRRERLAALILEEAERTGLARDAGASPADGPDEALKRIDAWLCDVKEMALKDGLHVYGRAAAGDEPGRRASAEAERAAILAALAGRRVAAGPAGSPARGRADVLPTGRNLYTADPRAIPTPTAVELGRRAADEVVRLYLQEHGDWPRAVVLDLWGSSTLRTGGEEIAEALALMGCRPVWHRASGRVTGVEVLPLAALGRPRVDVTCRISGLFRDLFPAQIALLDAAVQAVAAREEDDAENPLAARRRAEPADPLARIFGTAPGVYGSGIDERLTFGDWHDRAELGRAYLAAASHAFFGEGDGVEASGASSTADAAPPTADKTATANPPPSQWDANANPPPSWGRVGRGGAPSPSLDIEHHADHVSSQGISLADPESAAPPLPAPGSSPGQALPLKGGGFTSRTGETPDPKAAPEAFAARVASADMLVHGADDPGRDLLEGGGDVGFVGGFAAAAELLGRAPDLVVLDTRNPNRPVARPLAAELARVVRGRTLSKRFIAGQMRHGFRGAAELAETVDRLVGFAETTGAVPGHLLDAVHAAFLGDEAVRAFLLDANPDAARLIARRFTDARRRGLWHPRRNDVDADLAALMAEAVP